MTNEQIKLMARAQHVVAVRCATDAAKADAEAVEATAEAEKAYSIATDKAVLAKAARIRASIISDVAENARAAAFKAEAARIKARDES